MKSEKVEKLTFVNVYVSLLTKVKKKYVCAHKS